MKLRMFYIDIIGENMNNEELYNEAKKHKKEWKAGKGIKGSTRAAIVNHPDKFDPDCKDPNRLCPYAIMKSMQKKGAHFNYKDQESTLKGKPHKKKEKSSDLKFKKFKEWMKRREEKEVRLL
jgi:hypothetical protein